MMILLLPQIVVSCIIVVLTVGKNIVNADMTNTPTVTIKGYKFFEESGSKKNSIDWKGIDYYPRPNSGELDKNNIDFFTEEYRHIWERDIPILADLGVNAIRVYAVDPSKNHDAFMCTLSSAGIYIIIGLAANCEDCAITDETAPSCYPSSLKTRGQLIINEFSKYDNVIGFSAGNEVNLLQSDKRETAACQKKFIEDMRTYVKSCPNMRNIPIGVVVADIDREENALYYNCQDDDDGASALQNAEWFGINTYQHCDTDAETSDDAVGFRELKEEYRQMNLSIPIILTEYGCLNPNFPSIGDYDAQRTFNQAIWLFEEEYRDVFSGGFVFEYSTEASNSPTAPYPFTSYGPGNYGIGYLSPELCNDDKTNVVSTGESSTRIEDAEDDTPYYIPCTYEAMPQYYNLQKSYTSVNAINDNLSLENYVPDTLRTGRSVCPIGYPKLSDYTWSSESISDTQCSNENTFTCSNVDYNSDITKRPSSPPPNSPGETNEPSTQTPSLTPSVLPTSNPTFRPPCGCLACTWDVLNLPAKDSMKQTYTVDQRIQWLKSPEGGYVPEEEACLRVCNDDFFDVCPQCNPNHILCRNVDGRNATSTAFSRYDDIGNYYHNYPFLFLGGSFSTYIYATSSLLLVAMVFMW